MKFTCEKALLQAAISVASRTVATKSSIVALEGILVEAYGDNLSLTGYNLETGIRTTVPADIQTEGTLVLPARLFGDIVRKSADDVMTFDAQGYLVHITCGLSEFHILASDGEDYPELPSVEDKNGLTIAGGTMASMIRQTLFAVSDNQARPIHTGSLFDVANGGLNLVSVDGYRLAMRHEAILTHIGLPTFSFVVPGAALSEVEKICGEDETAITVTQGDRHVLFQMGNTTLVARRLEGTFLPYEQAIPSNNNIHIEANIRSLITSIERVSLMITDKLKSPLRCTFDYNSVNITTKTGIGDAVDTCGVAGDGQGLEIGFNHRYMLEALKAAPADEVRLELSTGVAPCVMRPKDGSDYFTYMVLPVRLKSGD